MQAPPCHGSLPTCAQLATISVASERSATWRLQTAGQCYLKVGLWLCMETMRSRLHGGCT